MPQSVIFVSIPGLRRSDLALMPNLSAIADSGSVSTLVPSFPAVTCSVQANLTTGVGPEQHGVIANGFYHRETGEVEMWTAWNEAIQAPQIWRRLTDHDTALTSAVWFPLLSKGAQAEYICTPAPIHNPDGSESLWCYTRPTELYGELRDALGHFPLHHFWGPLANIKSSDWIIDSAVFAAKRFQPRFFDIYLPHLDYAAQKHGPDSEPARQACIDLDHSFGRLMYGLREAGLGELHVLVASEYVITPVTDVAYPNRVLREAGYLALQDEEGHEQLMPKASRAWALVDHQLAHIFIPNPADVQPVAELFRQHPLVEEVLVGSDRARYGIDHPRSGEIVLIAKPEAWFAYYWWLDDSRAPQYARTVDIHRKPGYDPVEMFIEMPARSIPLDATLVKGSHGAPARDDSRCGVLISSHSLPQNRYRDVDVAGIILADFGVPASAPATQPA